MRAKLNWPGGRAWVAVGLVLLAAGQITARAAEMKFQAVLLWGTDDVKPPVGKTYKLADLEIRQKLKDLPLKWTNWFEVNRKAFAVLEGAAQRVAVSAKCQLNVRRVADYDVEVTLIGKGKEVVRRRQSLPKGEMLVLGGNAPNSTAWLVVLKRLE
jgi:hypothetical protein